MAETDHERITQANRIGYKTEIGLSRTEGQSDHKNQWNDRQSDNSITVTLGELSRHKYFRGT